MGEHNDPPQVSGGGFSSSAKFHVLHPPLSPPIFATVEAQLWLPVTGRLQVVKKPFDVAATLVAFFTKINHPFLWGGSGVRGAV